MFWNDAKISWHENVKITVLEILYNILFGPLYLQFLHTYYRTVYLSVVVFLFLISLVYIFQYSISLSFRVYSYFNPIYLFCEIFQPSIFRDFEATSHTSRIHSRRTSCHLLPFLPPSTEEGIITERNSTTGNIIHKF